MQVVNLQAELSYLQAHLATLELPSPPPPPPPTTLVTPPPLSIADLPSASTVPTTYDLSSLFEPMVQPWVMQQRPMDPRQFGSSGSSSGAGGGSGDLQALARELLHRHGSPPHGSMPCPDASSSPSL